jgi:hypothetical protein
MATQKRIADVLDTLLTNAEATGRIYEHVRTENNVATYRATQNVLLLTAVNVRKSTMMDRPCVAFCMKSDTIDFNVNATPITDTDPETGLTNTVYPIANPEALVAQCRRSEAGSKPPNFDPDVYKAGNPIYASRDSMCESQPCFARIEVILKRRKPRRAESGNAPR